jgi:hypothetical protein
MAFQTVTATFTGAEDSVAVSFSPTFTGNFGIASSVTVTDGNGPVFVVLTGRSGSGATVVPSARFSGTVEISANDHT